MSESESVVRISKVKPTVTTGQAAKVLDWAPRTVAKHFDQGRLRGYRIPGSNDRRIFVDSLREFIRELGIEDDRLDPVAPPVVLLYGGNRRAAYELYKECNRLGLSAWHADSSASLAEAVAQRPRAAVFDVAGATQGDREGMDDLATSLRVHTGLELVACLYGDDEGNPAPVHKWDRGWRAGDTDPEEVARWLNERLGKMPRKTRGG